VLRAVHARRHELNVTHWELFALRDADSARANPFHRFGIVRDDYSPKPAFERLRQTFAEAPMRREPEPPAVVSRGDAQGRPDSSLLSW
jgi:hypothetical protein